MPAQSLTDYTRAINGIAIFIAVVTCARSLYLLLRRSDLGYALFSGLYAATATVASALVFFVEPPVAAGIALHSLLLVFEFFASERDDHTPFFPIILLRAPTLAWLSKL